FRIIHVFMVIKHTTTFQAHKLHSFPKGSMAAIDKKSLFRRHGHPPAGTGLKEHIHGGKGSKPRRRSQFLEKTGCERNQAVDETAS
ncbi:MAG: hypothetical protein PHG55_12610, partial [Verrucomicrobiota bacterium]|nr:hypothetical protein [Verrucomicrobiota bacterium]